MSGRRGAHTIDDAARAAADLAHVMPALAAAFEAGPGRPGGAGLKKSMDGPLQRPAGGVRRVASKRRATPPRMARTTSRTG
jgi:hypothetical protein